MILDAQNKKVDVENIGEGSFKNKKAQITAKNTPYIFALLANIYSKPKDSIVREIPSNGFDGYIALNKARGLEDTSIQPDQIVFVRLYIDETEQHYLEVVDNGIGISETNMDEIYMSYGESDKRESNDFIGCFGLGSKSPFSYSNHFYVITKIGGIEYTYLLNQTQLGPEYDCLMKQEVTDGSSGTTVRIPIKKEDVGAFEKAIISQLKYFTNVYVANFPNVKNDYVIKKFKSFQIREDLFLANPQASLHLVLGNVTYPIRFEDLGLKNIGFNGALIFKVGELEIAPNREEIKYEAETTKKILDKIEEFIIELKEIISTESNFQCENIIDFRSKSLQLKDNKQIFVSNILNKEIQLSLNSLGFNIENLTYKLKLDEQYFHIDYSILNPESYSIVQFNRSSNTNRLVIVKRSGSSSDKNIKAFDELTGKYVINYKDTLKLSERAWLNEKMTTLKVLKMNLKPLIKKISIYFFNKHSNISYQDRKKIILDFKTKYENEIINKNFIYLNTLDIPANYGKKPRISTRNTIKKSANTILYYGFSGGIWQREEEVEAVLAASNEIIIYGLPEQKEEIKSLYYFLNDFKVKKRCLTTNKKYHTILEKYDNCYSIDEILEKKYLSKLFNHTELLNFIKEIFVQENYVNQKNKLKFAFDYDDLNNIEGKFTDIKQNHLDLPELKLFLQLISKFYTSSTFAKNNNTYDWTLRRIENFVGDKGMKFFINKFKTFYKKEKSSKYYYNFCKDFFLELHFITNSGYSSYGDLKREDTLRLLYNNLKNRKTILNNYYQKLKK